MTTSYRLILLSLLFEIIRSFFSLAALSLYFLFGFSLIWEVKLKKIKQKKKKESLLPAMFLP